MAKQKTFVITNVDVKKLIDMKEKEKSIKGTLEALGSEIKDYEIKFAQAIDSKKLAKDLKFDLKIQKILRRFPAWKEHFISKLGLKAADQILKKTKPVEYTHIKIAKKTKIETME